jgi:acetyl-CoA C-acetyltransferase
LQRANIDPSRIDDVIMEAGNEWGTQSSNIGRLTIYAAGLPMAKAQTSWPQLIVA